MPLTDAEQSFMIHFIKKNRFHIFKWFWLNEHDMVQLMIDAFKDDKTLFYENIENFSFTYYKDISEFPVEKIKGYTFCRFLKRYQTSDMHFFLYVAVTYCPPDYKAKPYLFFGESQKYVLLTKLE